MNVLSLFDGISCGLLALDRAGIPVTGYYASEIDKQAQAVSHRHHGSRITRIGDVSKVSYANGVLTTENGTYDVPGGFQLVIAGSPCTTVSCAGDGSGFEGESGLYWHFSRILKEVQPDAWMLENVKMKAEWRDVISADLGVEPVLINSHHFSGQHRMRYYWTNFLIDNLPERGVSLESVLLPLAEVQELAHTAKAIAYMDRISVGKTSTRSKWSFKYHSDTANGKSQCVVSNFTRGVPNNVLIDRRVDPPLIRKFHPVECERLQTLPDGYTEGVGVGHRYQMIGNGWTVDVVAHILSSI